MVQVTKGKNVVIETYDAEFKEFIATAVTIPACTAGQVVQIYMPRTKNGAYSVQQAIQMQVSTKTIEIAELGNDAVHRGCGAESWRNVAKKYMNTNPVSYRIYGSQGK